ncbi:GNAT family N-acetyltransferase [Bacillus cereus group sp. BfR-BA-01380]|uniref:GNAT family N-acetyltransferase n=1 Tax=Bacillus cereus group sp. BfR-BA-01380 TaxID=2920324 RepID=UPI001F578AB5|nr:GNAT family N-acetyltransferase [Bacillus cereus group sp. BfR-BA-01380]
MKKICLKNGKEVMIREAVQEDAQSMINFYNIVGGETDFLSFGKNEFGMPLHDYENFIESTRTDNNSIILLATMDDEIISIASITSSQKMRTKHVGTLGIVIAEEHCGFGLGKELMEELIEWARRNGATKKIHLVTREDNDRAIELYKKVGFKEEGLLEQDTYINGVYYNTLIMGLML